MSIRSGYNPNVVTFGIMLENYSHELYAHADYLDWNGGYTDEWQDAVDRFARIQWMYEQWQTIFPGVTDCEHGLSLQNCYGTQHYSDEY